MVTPILVERTLTTAWSTTLLQNSSANTRRTSLKTRELSVNVQRELSHHPPKLTLRLTLCLKALTSTPAFQGPLRRAEPGLVPRHNGASREIHQ